MNTLKAVKGMASIIIVNWNGLEHLKICLPEIEKQSYRNFEIILVDNKSADQSVKYIKENHKNIKLIELDKNYGFDLGNIEGLQEANGEYIILLNNDTRPRIDWLYHLIESAEKNPKAGIVGSVMLRWDSQVIDTAGDGCTWAGVGYKMYSGQEYATLPECIQAFGACAGAALYRRSMIDDIGFLDSQFFMNLEDVDISYRARLANYDIDISRLSIVEHRVGASVKKVSGINTYYASRNIELVWWKNTPNRYIVRSIPHKIIHLIVSFINSFENPIKAKNYLKGKFDAYVLIFSRKIDRIEVQKHYEGQNLRLSSEVWRITSKLGRKDV